jgi:adenosyl cobinamide kinase/adenosyl cobinamide phosphate guanylyltransferase
MRTDVARPGNRAADPPHLTLLLGGVRSGKSARAVALARETPNDGRVLFVATAQGLDDDMARRIAAHRAERPAGWDTLESPIDLPSELARALANAHAARVPYATVAIDCLTLWVSNLLLSLDDPDEAEAAIAGHVTRLLAVRDTARRMVAGSPRWIVVSNEVGLGVVPPTPLGRRYRDALGRANRMVAAAADEVTLMVAGLELPLKGRAHAGLPALRMPAE